MIDLKSPVKLYKDEIAKIQELLNTLQPGQLAVKALSARQCNLVTSESIPEFLFDSLHDMPNRNISTINLLEAIKTDYQKGVPKTLFHL